MTRIFKVWNTYQGLPSPHPMSEMTESELRSRLLKELDGRSYVPPIIPDEGGQHLVGWLSLRWKLK